MSVEQQIRHNRRARNRRWVFGLLFCLVALGVFVRYVDRLPQHSPRAGIGSLAFAAAICVTNFMWNGNDSFQRQRALLCFATGAAVGLAWAVAFTLWPELGPAQVQRTSTVLSVTGLVWMLMEFALRRLPDMLSSSDDDE